MTRRRPSLTCVSRAEERRTSEESADPDPTSQHGMSGHTAALLDVPRSGIEQAMAQL
jgi:hypothetical protein